MTNRTDRPRTAIEERIASIHPENLAALAREVAEVFAPVIDAMNVGFALQQDMLTDPDQFINRLDSTLSKLVDRVDTDLKRITDRLTNIESEQRKILEAVKFLTMFLGALPEKQGGPKNGESQ
jgi:hypothetical protein